MPNRANALTAAAGEHYVAYRLSRMEYLVGLTRSGSPSVDLMVCHPEKGTQVSIQVKTSKFAHRYERRKKIEYWAWRVGKQVASLPGDSIVYAFVSLEGDKGDPICRTFIVPSKEVAARVETDGPNAYWFITDGFAIDDKNEKKWLEDWRLITDTLTGDK